MENIFQLKMFPIGFCMFVEAQKTRWKFVENMWKLNWATKEKNKQNLSQLSSYNILSWEYKNDSHIQMTTIARIQIIYLFYQFYLEINLSETKQSHIYKSLINLKN